MPVTMPTAIVLIVCKTILSGEPDPNEGFTHHQNRDWAIEGGMMICRRQEIQLYDQAEDANAQPLNPDLTNPAVCSRVGMPVGVKWDEQHQSSPYRFWKVGCPSRVVDMRTGRTIGFHMPDCGHRDTVICETDSAI